MLNLPFLMLSTAPLYLREAARMVEEVGAPALAERLAGGIRPVMTPSERVALADLLIELGNRLR